MIENDKIQQLWTDLQKTYALSEKQLEQFKQYAHELQKWNQKFNLTALTSMDDIISYHFDDSLALSQHYDLATVASIADVGTGAGFPIIPLKILFPQLAVILIEVSQKKVTFLEHMVELLGLTDVTIYPHDWKMFVRKTSYPVDMIIARASLRPEDLIFMFKPSSLYKDAVLVYWASAQWIGEGKAKEYITKEADYEVYKKKRKLVFFKLDNQ